MDPSGGGSGIGKAAQEMMKEMQRAQQQEMQQLQDLKKTGSEGFEQHIQSHEAQKVNQAHKVQATEKAHNILQQAKINQNLPTTRVGAAQKAKSSRVVSMLQGLVKGQDKMKRIMKLALSSRKMQPQELLALQAGVYRFSQELELTSKVVEKATSGVKQTMNTQV